jgi:hypothetical protein
MVILVEGPGDQQALPVLARRLQPDAGVKCIDMKGKSNIVRRNRGFEDTVRRQQALGQNRFAILIDGDVTSTPYQTMDEERQDMPRRAQALADELRVSVQVFWAVLAMESWLIGGLRPGVTVCGLRDVPQIPANTETSPHRPKQWLTDRLQNRQYTPRTQACLASQIDLNQARQRNRSIDWFMENIEPAVD